MTVWWRWPLDVGRKHLAGILAAAVVVVLVQFGLLENLEHWSLDQLFEWRGPRKPTLDVVLVTIDESTVVALNMPADADNQVRRVPLWAALETERLPTLDVQLHALLAKAGVRVAPLPDRDSIFINFRGGPRTYPWVSYYRVVRGEIPAEYWRDKGVLIGPTTEGFHDKFCTPLAPGGEMPRAEIHAHALETLLR